MTFEPVGTTDTATAQPVTKTDARPLLSRLGDQRTGAREQRKCAFGSRAARLIERLKRECLRDGGTP
jgi:hypothetical protein